MHGRFGHSSGLIGSIITSEFFELSKLKRSSDLYFKRAMYKHSRRCAKCISAYSDIKIPSHGRHSPCSAGVPPYESNGHYQYDVIREVTAAMNNAVVSQCAHRYKANFKRYIVSDVMQSDHWNQMDKPGILYCGVHSKTTMNTAVLLCLSFTFQDFH